jgi:hypothetical protein
LRKRAPSVLDACVAKRGLHRGAVTAAWVAQYALQARDLGRVPTVVEYSTEWNIDERSGWRHREAIREVFGDSWRDVVLSVAAAIERRSTSAVLALPVPA